MKQTKVKLAIFGGKQIRRRWDEKKELWYFAIMDVIQVLAQTDRPRKYWNDLKSKLKKEGSELSEKIGQLKMQASDGKYGHWGEQGTILHLALARKELGCKQA